MNATVQRRLILIAVGVATAMTAAACTGGGARLPSGRLAIAVAPLDLAGVGDADYTITVTNGATQTIWTRSLSSSAYGDGAGSLSYVGTCDADEPQTTITLDLDELYDAGHAPLPAGSWANPTPVSLEAVCVADADVAVAFDMTISRKAQQGFFDVAVTFQDVFCSAKLDCEADTGGDLELLYNPGTQSRDMTAVLGLACATRAAGGASYLYMDDPTIDCDGFTAPIVVDPTALGNVDLSAEPNANADGYLFGAGVYRGHQAGGVAYWNVSLGLDDTTFGDAEGCTLTGRATASSEPFPQTIDGFPLPEASVYPVISWSVPLSTTGGRACTRHELDADGRVTTDYLGYLTAPNQLTWADDVIALQHRYEPSTGEVLSALPSTPSAPVTCFGDSVLPDGGAYPRVLHVATWGRDTGPGSEAWPFLRLDQAVAAAVDGDAIHIHGGLYRATPVLVAGTSGHIDAGIYDAGKSLHIFGDNDDTVIEVYGPDGIHRDYSVFALTGPSSVVSNLSVRYWPSHGSSYSNAIMAFSSGTAEIRNVVVENLGSQNWSYIYDNNTSGGPAVYSSIFISNGRSTTDYSGSPTYTHTLFDATPSRGTLSNTVTRTVTPDDLWLSTLPADLASPSGVDFNIGTAGGTYPWDTCCPDDGSTDSDGDGHPDSCDLCPDELSGDADHDGLCTADDPCPASSDNTDSDGDDIPDACDPCPDDPADGCAALPDPSSFGTIWHVAKWGDDVTGDGTESAPFASLHVAVAAAADGDGVYVWPGQYHTTNQAACTGYGRAGINDTGKALHIWGANEHTIVEVYGSESSARDGHAVCLRNDASVLSNLTVHYYPGKPATQPYSNAIFGWPYVNAQVRNVRFENKAAQDWTFIYDNTGGGGPRVHNCVFEANGLQRNDYSGAPHYHSCLFSETPTRGTQTGCLTRGTTTFDWFASSLPADLENLGDPSATNLDGSRAHIGTGGGHYPWVSSCAPDGTADSDGDGPPDHCDACPADPIGDEDGDGLCD